MAHIIGSAHAEDSDQELEDREPKLWGGWGPRQMPWGGLGQSSGIHFQLQAFLMLSASGEFTLKAGGKKGNRFVISLPMLMDPRYKFFVACPEL